MLGRRRQREGWPQQLSALSARSPARQQQQTLTNCAGHTRMCKLQHRPLQTGLDDTHAADPWRRLWRRQWRRQPGAACAAGQESCPLLIAPGMLNALAGPAAGRQGAAGQRSAVWRPVLRCSTLHRREFALQAANTLLAWLQSELRALGGPCWAGARSMLAGAAKPHQWHAAA